MWRVTVQRDTSGNGTSHAAVPSIPLSEDYPATRSGAADTSIGGLVRDASTHLSTLIRAEVELAKSEVTAEVKKGVKGSVFFVVALTVLLFSLFFFFFALAELLYDLGLYRSAAFGIVFVLMLAVAGLFGFLGYRKVRKIRAPERTISSAKDTMSALRSRGGGEHAEQPTR
jgi:uncharacterized membrane protein YqjE